VNVSPKGIGERTLQRKKKMGLSKKETRKILNGASATGDLKSVAKPANYTGKVGWYRGGESTP